MRYVAVIIMLLASGAAVPVAAQSYPTKTVRLVAPFPPGGSVDVVGRILAEKLTQNLGRQVIVDNRSGASGIVGTEIVAKAPPDGYTLLINTLPLVLLAGVNIVAVQFKGGGPADVATISGEVAATFGNISQQIGYIKAGRLRALACPPRPAHGGRSRCPRIRVRHLARRPRAKRDAEAHREPPQRAVEEDPHRTR